MAVVGRGQLVVPGGGGHGLRIRDKPSGRRSSQPAAPGPPGRGLDWFVPMISPGSFWWPNRPALVPKPWAAGLLAGLGVVLFSASALSVKQGATSWDARLFRILNQVPSAAAWVLTPLSHLFGPAAIIAVVLVTVVYVVARNRSVMPVAATAVAAGAAWVLANVAKVIADRPRPYEVMAGAVLRQQPAHGASFPSSHTAVALAVVIALVPFLARPLAAAGIAYAWPGGLVPGLPRGALSPGRPGRSWYRDGSGRRDLVGPPGAALPRRPGRERPRRPGGCPDPQGRPGPNGEP